MNIVNLKKHDKNYHSINGYVRTSFLNNLILKKYPIDDIRDCLYTGSINENLELLSDLNFGIQKNKEVGEASLFIGYNLDSEKIRKKLLSSGISDNDIVIVKDFKIIGFNKDCVNHWELPEYIIQVYGESVVTALGRKSFIDLIYFLQNKNYKHGYINFLELSDDYSELKKHLVDFYNDMFEENKYVEKVYNYQNINKYFLAQYSSIPKFINSYNDIIKEDGSIPENGKHYIFDLDDTNLLEMVGFTTKMYSVRGASGFNNNINYKDRVFLSCYIELYNYDIEGYMVRPASGRGILNCNVFLNNDDYLKGTYTKESLASMLANSQLKIFKNDDLLSSYLKQYLVGWQYNLSKVNFSNLFLHIKDYREYLRLKKLYPNY